MLQLLETYSKNRFFLLVVFVFYFLIRLIFCFSVGFYNNYELQPDSYMYDMLSERILSGNFDFDVGRYVVSPLYAYLIAFFKIVFGVKWKLFLIITQIAIASVSGVYLYKMCNMLFRNQHISVIATLAYGVFPLTLWWSHTFATESLFQSLLIVSVYYFLRAIILQHQLYSSIVFSSVLLSLSYLTKSHILLFTPLIVLAIGLSKLSLKNKLITSGLYTAICLIFSLPFGLLNLSLHDTYVISSNGGPFLFLYGNSEMAYRTIVKVPEKNSIDYNRMKDADLSYFSPEINLDSIFNLPLKKRNAVFMNIAKKWIQDNPDKFIRMKIYNLFFFLLPGISYRHYDFIKWFFSFIISLPIYLLAYYGICVAIQHDYSKHFWILGLFLIMLFFSLVFYVQNRFRTITLEPFYIMYAAYGFYHLKSNTKHKSQPA